MTATVTNIACAYIHRMEKWIDLNMYGIECTNEDLLNTLERDLFRIQVDCTSEYCYTETRSTPDCDSTITCGATLIDITTPIVCDSTALINL